MRAYMNTDVFHWHGYAEIEIEGRWLKATPAFNRELCERFGLKTLEFDGRSDSLYHPFDRHGQRHMEYVAQRGSFDDVPLARMVADLARLYPDWRPGPSGLESADFAADVAREARPAGR
jgi:hypothetical protein